MSNYRLINQLLDRAEKLEIEPYQIGRDMHDLMRRYPKMSLSKLSNILAAQFTFRSPRYYRSLHNIYLHFCVQSGIKIDDLPELDYKILRTIAETKKVIFDPQTTRFLFNKIKSECYFREDAWKLIKDTKMRRITETNVGDRC